MNDPLILAVHCDPPALRVLSDALQQRYSHDYEVRCVPTAFHALALLADWKHDAGEVAIILAGQRMTAMSGIKFLLGTRRLAPFAKRVLLTCWGDQPASQPIHEGSTLGYIDDYVPMPRVARDEGFHRAVTECLEDWSRRHRPVFEAVQIIGTPSSARSHELCDLFERHSVPYGFYDATSDRGRAILKEAAATADGVPVLRFQDGNVMRNPSNIEIASALGARERPSKSSYDLVIVGAGPAGLGAAVYGASEGLGTLVVEREAIGGQAGASSLIRNYLGFPRGISGRMLAAQAYQQAWRFGAEFALVREATRLQRAGANWRLTLSGGAEVEARAVVLATGSAYRRLNVPGIDRHVGRSVFYGAAVTEAPRLKGMPVCVVGAGNSAGQAAMHLAKYASRVTLLVRGATLASSMSSYLIEEIETAVNIDVLLETEVIEALGTSRLEGLALLCGNRSEPTIVPAAALFVLIGVAPQATWLPSNLRFDASGFIVTGSDLLGGPSRLGWTLDRAPFPMETSLSGVFAVGDVRSGSVKRVASAVGEGAMVIQQVHGYLATFPDRSAGVPHEGVQASPYDEGSEYGEDSEAEPVFEDALPAA